MVFLSNKFTCGFPGIVFFFFGILPYWGYKTANTEYSKLSSHFLLNLHVKFAFPSYPNSVSSVEPLNLPGWFFLFFSGLYVCLIKVRPQSEELLQALSMADTSVYGWATLVSERSKNGMQRILIPFIPAFYINQSELVFRHKQDIVEIRVLAVDTVLEKLEVC